MPTMDAPTSLPETTTAPNTALLVASIMELLAGNVRKQQAIAANNATLRLTITQWLATQDDPETTRHWLESQPFAPLGLQIPLECLSGDEEERTTTATPTTTARTTNGAKKKK